MKLAARKLNKGSSLWIHHVYQEKKVCTLQASIFWMQFTFEMGLKWKKKFAEEKNVEVQLDECKCVCACLKCEWHKMQHNIGGKCENVHHR